MTENAKLLIDGREGIYIPEIFADIINWKQIEDIRDLYKPLSVLLNGPSDPIYWDQWQYVLDCCILIDPNGDRFTLHHDMDLWAIPVDEIDQIPEV